MAKILFVYASYGNGHKLAAESIKDFFNAECVDILDYMPRWVKRSSIWFYHFASGPVPRVWQLMFHLSQTVVGAKVVKLAEKLLFGRFCQYIKDSNPDVIVSTHFTPPSVLKNLKLKLNFKIIAYVTDMAAHRLWYDVSVDKYFTLTDKAKTDLLRFGVDSDDIYVGYVSVREGFLLTNNQEALRAKWGIDQRPCLLFMASTLGKFPFLKKFVEDEHGNYNFIVVYGKNVKLKKYFEQRDYDGVVLLRFCSQIWELMDICDLLVTKPGGMTVTEGCFLKKKFVFTTFIYGQEESNIDILADAGLGKYLDSYNEFRAHVKYALEEKNDSGYPIQFSDIRTKLRDVIAEITSNNARVV